MKLAVYGTLKRGGINHPLLNRSTYLGTDTVQGALFIGNQGLYPYYSSQGTNQVEVEVYEIDQATLDSVEYMECFEYNTHIAKTKYGAALIYEVKPFVLATDFTLIDKFDASTFPRSFNESYAVELRKENVENLRTREEEK